ncbi:mannonate dehydratase [Bacillus sp. FJAT-50079]|uniref:mannonate dehydratase n=1 Tax=Bacillus sp. FJAT-50079 TaxID=2833577 RepID=UPI001BCA22C6|nr:mannonate dehydratase [Bacillus sp. FJAT-50079]MBS4209333.1 mannonate dehydratase [Bacillus sp. FJAT-50079]
MKVSFRWFGSTDDSVSLAHIKQIPGIEGIVGTLPDIQAGEIWPLDRIMELKEEIESYGLKLEVIESVNIHEDIKLGLPSRDRYIQNYIETMRHLASAGIKVICYNFMPVFDWIRSDLAKMLEDDSTVLAYEKEKVETLDPSVLFGRMEGEANGFSLPGWEEERMKLIEELFEQYKNVNEEALFANLQYFLEKVIPIAEECDIKMALHPDDPPWSVFGLPRIVTNKANLERIIQLVDSPANGLTICTGSLGANPENDIPEILDHFCKKDRVPFVHIRNIKMYENGDFEERSHLNRDGSLNMPEIVKVLCKNEYTGYFRPDHGRMIWGEQARPGYGLYDRALGIMYILGLWDSLENSKKGRKECYQSMNN